MQHLGLGLVFVMIITAQAHAQSPLGKVKLACRYQYAGEVAADETLEIDYDKQTVGGWPAQIRPDSVTWQLPAALGVSSR